MHIFQDLNGGVLHSAREYPIAKETKISVGQVVKLAAGVVVPAAVGETGEILGYAAENHVGAEDALNERANGTVILVEDAPNAMAESAAPTITATGGTETTVTAAGVAAFAANVFKGGVIKGSDGAVRQITGSAVDGGTLTLTVEKGEVPTAGDVFKMFPPVGFSGGNLSADGTKLVLSATANLSIMVVGKDVDRGTVHTMATKHFLANSR